jgi:hypothetical protein
MPLSPERHAAYMREYAKNNPRYREQQARAQRKYAAANREKIEAHTAVKSAVQHGVLVRPETCARCGKVGKVEASHSDYSEPLDVEWLCRMCHLEKDGLRSRKRP